MAKLSEICEIKAGGTPSRAKQEYWNGTIPWVKISDFNGKYVNATSERITEEGLNNSSTKIIKKGSILFTIFATLGEVAILNIDATTNQAIASLTLNNSNVDIDYLYYFLTSLKKYVNELGRGVAQNNINISILRNIEIPLPPLEKQKQIADTLDKVTHTIDTCNAILEKLNLLVKSQFVEMFGSVYEERFDTITIPQFASKDKNSIKRGPFGGTLKKEDFVENGYLVYEQRHAIHNDFQYEKYFITREKYESMIGFKVVPGDLIISCSGVTLGRIAEIPNGAKEGIINQALLKLSLDKTKMMNAFFIHQFRSEEIQDILFGFSRGSGIPNMPSMSEVKAVKFICPPLELQQQFADFVQQNDKTKQQVKRVLEKAETLKKALMQDYFGQEKL